MRISSLTLIVTDDCNFDCAYCYHKKSKDSLEYPLAERALLFFCRG